MVRVRVRVLERDKRFERKVVGRGKRGLMGRACPSLTCIGLGLDFIFEPG